MLALVERTYRVDVLLDNESLTTLVGRVGKQTCDRIIY